MPTYDYSVVEQASDAINMNIIWTVIALMLAVVGGIALYYTVFSKDNNKKYSGLMAKIYNLVHFKSFIINDLFKICYLVSALAVTLMSLNLIGTNFLYFILLLTIGNVAVRLAFELMMLFLELCNNVRDINKKIK